MKIKRILLITGGIFFAFVFSIFLDRLMGEYLDASGYFRAMTPNLTEIYDNLEFQVTSKISSQGIRNEEVVIPKPADSYRILALGDSFTYGWGVELKDSWPKLLEKSISKPGKRVEVINAGVPGSDLTTSRRVCRAYVDLFDVDMVVIGFLGTDDFYQAAVREISRRSFAGLIADIWPTLSRLSKQTLITSWSKDIQPGQTIVASDYWREEALASVRAEPGILLHMDFSIRDEYLKGRINPAFISNAYVDPNYFIKMLNEDNFRYALDSAKLRFERLKERCIKNKPAIVIFIPTGMLVTRDIFPYRNSLGYNVNEKILDLDIDTPLKKIVEEQGFIYFSLLPKFRQMNCFDCFYPWDFHLNKRGHQEIAAYIAEELRRRGSFE